MNAAPAWMRVAPYRACDLCRHGANSGKVCSCPEVLAQGSPQPIDQVRAAGGACGPDARHLDLESWQ